MLSELEFDPKTSNYSLSLTEFTIPKKKKEHKFP